MINCCVGLSIVCLVIGYQVNILTANGTAVEGVCVTGEAIRQLVPVAWQGTVPVASRYGAIFAITVREGFITIAV